MEIQVPFSVASSKAFISKNGEKFVKVSGSVAGFGIFQFIVRASKVPDEIEGKIFVIRFRCYVDREFNLRLGFDSFVEEITNA